MPLHVLDDHDRIVDDDADGEHEAEERESIEREAEAEHHGEGADERYRHGNERDDRRPPRLQEHDDDNHDEQDGLEKRFDDGMNGFAHVDRRVVDDAVFDAGWKRLLEPLHRLAHFR